MHILIREKFYTIIENVYIHFIASLICDPLHVFVILALALNTEVLFHSTTSCLFTPGAFLIPFLIFMVLCGFPLFYLEVALGQFSSLSCLAVWRICPLLKGIGYGMVIVSGILSLYYIMMIVWTMYFLVMSCMPELPWASCDNPFNTDHCILSRKKNNTTPALGLMNSSMTNITLAPTLGAGTDLFRNSTLFSTTTAAPSHYRTAAEEFWE